MNDHIQLGNAVVKYLGCRTGATLWLMLAGVAGGTLLGGAYLLLGPNWFGAGRYQTHPIPLGPAMPAPDNSLVKQQHLPTAEGQAALAHWSQRPLPDWSTHDKVTAPRVALAKLASNRDIEATNQYLRAAKPRRGVGSTWALHYGDHDFTLTTLTTILYMFGEQPDRLYPETRDHLLDALLTEEGAEPLVTVPRTHGLILDTENHHLMTEGSRYLKNQWLARHGTTAQREDPRYDNSANGLEAWLVAYLEEMRDEGVYEFNSRPYMSYTMQALLNLEVWPESPRIRKLARYLLDIMNLQYALGSHGLRNNPPFRRRYENSGNTTLNQDPHTAHMRVWSGPRYEPGAPLPDLGPRSTCVLVAELLPYRPPAQVLEWTRAKAKEYFVRYGRGASACPELYSGGPDYLLSAGGANRGFRSHIVARPITLLLNDGETDVTRCLHLTGQGHWRRWNNTGVYHRFACANGAAHIPEHMVAAASEDGWRVFQAPDVSRLLIVVYCVDDFSLIALFPESDQTPEALLASVRAQNGDNSALRRRFVWPRGHALTYDVDAPKGVWVMKSDDEQPLDRDYDSWPQLSGEAPSISFSREFRQ